MRIKADGEQLDDVIELEDTAGEEVETTVIDGETGEVQGGETKDEDVDEVVVAIGEEAPPPEEKEHAPEWVRELRKNHRELQRKNRELEDQLKATTTAETKPAILGKKPSLEDFDYDTEKFEQELSKWYDRKRDTDKAAAEAEVAQKEQQKAWQTKLDSYGKLKGELKVKDFEDAEAAVQDTFNVTQQGIVLQGAENSALVIYALGKNPKKAAELATIKDPVKFAFAVAKLETQLKVTNRKAATAPEKTVQGTGRVSGTVDSTLERLRAEAEKTGDMTKVMEYKRQKHKA
jgi:desulfoferrodoxin (superoxide reductase-like protein)